MNKVLKIISIIILVIIVIACALIITAYMMFKGKLNKINYIDIPVEDIEMNEGVQENLNEYRNIALLGIDTRANTYSGSRTDCIIIVSINEKTKEVKLASVYRDTYLEISGKNYTPKLDKVNHAYNFGGPALTMSTLNTNLDLDITEFVTVNFSATQDIVDKIGGITLQIDPDEVKHITGITTSGKHHLNGSQALQYARIRKESGGDYKRTERQRTVIMAVFEKAKSLGISELNSLVDMLLPEIYTNIERDEIVSLIPEIASYKVTETTGWPYKTAGKTINGVWYGPPITLESNVIQLHKELFGDENYQPTEKIIEISNKIIQKTGYR